MKFKLLHVRPHVWFFKQKETISKATSDDSSSEGPYVYKRSTSLKLVKSDPSPGIAKRKSDASKPSSNTVVRSQNQRKDVQVCTVVDAGCTCRATVSSQHKEKKGMGVLPSAKGDLGSLHDVCRPRWAQVFEAREDVGSKHDVCRPRRGQLNSKRAASTNASPPHGTSSSVVSRLVCKSSQDAVKHSQLNVEHCDVVCKLTQDEGKQFEARASYRGDMVACLDVHQLECRLRNAGLEERRRSSKKKNKYYEEGPSTISSGISSSNSINTNTDSLITGTTTEMEDMLLNANPAFDTDVASMGDSMLSLEELRASIAQRKLANQASPRGKDAAPTDGMRENVTFTSSPSSLGSKNIKVACIVSPPCVRNPVRHACKEVSEKHVDVGVNTKLCISECNDLSNQGLVKQSKKASIDTSTTHKEAVRDDSKLLRRASRRIELRAQKGLDAHYEVGKSIVTRVSTGLAKGEVHEATREAQNKLHEADSESELGFVVLEGPICAAANDDIGLQEKQVVSSSSCEIQVLSDYSHDHHSDGNHSYPMIRMHVTGTSLPGAVAHRQGAACSLEATVGTSISTHAVTAASHVQGTVHPLEADSLGHELMRSDSAVAMVKSSYDPKRDFKESMLEMVVAKRLCAPRQLQQLLQCYLSLNPSHYHPTIIKVFHELCSELFN